MKFRFFKLFSRLTQTRRSRRESKSKSYSADRWLILAAISLSLFGILMVYDASVAIAIRDFSDQYHFVREQLQWLAFGFLAFTVFSFIDYHRWYKLALPMLLGTLGLLLAVFVPGIGLRALGANRWLNFGWLVVQPAELAKLTLLIYLSAWFAFKELGRLIPFLVLLAMVVGLVVLEPDLGTGVVILATALVIYFLSGAPVYHFLILTPILAGGVIFLAVISPYRFARITTFLNPESDPLGASYQIRQTLLALGSGGLLGVGIGKSRQKYEYLPEANTDSIFAIVGEEVGFIGASALIILFLFLIWRGFRIAKRAPDQFGRLLALGISSWIAVQVVINLAANVALIPLTGVPLPLISYGGSGLVVVLTALGILLNISRQRN